MPLLSLSILRYGFFFWFLWWTSYGCISSGPLYLEMYITSACNASIYYQCCPFLKGEELQMKYQHANFFYEDHDVSGQSLMILKYKCKFHANTNTHTNIQTCTHACAHTATAILLTQYSCTHQHCCSLFYALLSSLKNNHVLAHIRNTSGFPQALRYLLLFSSMLSHSALISGLGGSCQHTSKNSSEVKALEDMLVERIFVGTISTYLHSPPQTKQSSPL